ncbi:methyltransferase family protein [Isachenkonia alkalipeptolytica]|nr:isoprenylcysteine carboxylmethyltransferase family protein [Isachenkonia alkalipeptolytica]
MNPYLQWNLSYILFYSITALWLLELILFPSKNKSQDYKEQRSFYMLLLTIVSNVFITLLFTYYRVFQIQESPWNSLQSLGLIFCFGGIVLRYTSRLLPDKSFNRVAPMDKTQVPFRQGPYRVLRHPLYLGLFLLVLGVPTFFKNPVAMSFTVFSMARVLNRRMELKEKNMEMLLGETYRQWKKRRYRFIPFIY